VPNAVQAASTLAIMRMTVALAPLVFLALSCIAMLLNPLGRRSTEAPETAGAAA
jgi:GPH family glycoside/pentoside/hexuronide:cation symporter